MYEDPFQPETGRQMAREMRVGLIVLTAMLGLFAYVAWFKIAKPTELPAHVLAAPIAEQVWPHSQAGQQPVKPPTMHESLGNLLSSARESLSPFSNRSGKGDRDEQIPAEQQRTREQLVANHQNLYAAANYVSENNSDRSAVEPILIPAHALETNVDRQAPESVASTHVARTRSDNPVVTTAETIDKPAADSESPPGVVSTAPAVSSSTKPSTGGSFNPISLPSLSSGQTTNVSTTDIAANGRVPARYFAPSAGEPIVETFTSRPLTPADILDSGHAPARSQPIPESEPLRPDTLRPDTLRPDTLRPEMVRTSSPRKPTLRESGALSERQPLRNGGEHVETQRAEIQPPVTHERPSDGLYLIQKDDSFFSIAQAVYNDGRLFRSLYYHNRNHVDDFETPTAGITISIPDVSELLRLWPEQCPVDLLNSSRTISADRFHVTREGETLFDIARTHLGQASRYLDIMRLNDVRLPDDAGHLSPLPEGLRLVLPLE